MDINEQLTSEEEYELYLYKETEQDSTYIYKVNIANEIMYYFTAEDTRWVFDCGGIVEYIRVQRTSSEYKSAVYQSKLFDSIKKRSIIYSTNLPR